MTPATSVSVFRSEFDDFLYAAIGADKNDMPLSVLSALARLNLDPWQQAAELRDMSKTTATQRLAELIAQLPGEWARPDLPATAQRLIELLPRGATSKVLLEGTTPVLSGNFSMPSKNVIMYALFALLGTAAILMVTASREPGSQDIYHYVPADGSPRQTNH
jgi:hypothetical protein